MSCIYIYIYIYVCVSLCVCACFCCFATAQEAVQAPAMSGSYAMFKDEALPVPMQWLLDVPEALLRRAPRTENPMPMTNAALTVFRGHAYMALRNWVKMDVFVRHNHPSVSKVFLARVHPKTLQLQAAVPPLELSSPGHGFECRGRGMKRLPGTGMEDPRLVEVSGRLLLLYNRHPLMPHPQTLCTRTLGIVRQYVAWLDPESATWGAPDGGSAGGTLMSKPVMLQRVTPPELRAQTGTEDGESQHFTEKNWVPFVRDGVLYMAVTLRPHTVCRVDMTHGRCTVQYVTSAKASRALANVPQEWQLSGGTPGVLVEPSLSGSDKPYYLAVAHQRQRRPGTDWGVYVHWAYAFAAYPPFRVLALSKPLPLLTLANQNDGLHARPSRARIAFATGLIVQPDGTVVISYGSGDDRSRLMRVPLAELEAQMFGARR